MNTKHNEGSSQEGNIEERLWNYIDGKSSLDERSFVEKLLQTNLEWKEKYKTLLAVQEMLRLTELESPSMRFTKNVMEEIARLHIAPATRSYINKKIIWGLAFFFISLVVGFLIYGFGSVDWTVKSDTKLPVDFTKVNYSKIFSNTYVNVFMMINVVLGLFLLDRYLANKRKKYTEEI